MAYKVQFPDGKHIVIESLSERIEYLCKKDFYEPILFSGKVSENIEAWNVSIYKEKNLIIIDLPLKPTSLTIKVIFVDKKGNLLSGMSKYAEICDSSNNRKIKVVGDTLFVTYYGEDVKDICRTSFNITDETYSVSSVKYNSDSKELFVTVIKVILGSVRLTVCESKYDGIQMNLTICSVNSKQPPVIENINFPYQINNLKVGSYKLTIKSEIYKTFTTNFEIKSEEVLDIPIKLIPSLKYRTIRILKDNTKHIAYYVFMVVVMLSVLFFQFNTFTYEICTLTNDYTDKITQIEDRNSILLDSVLLLKTVMEANTHKSLDKNIKQTEERIAYLLDRLKGINYTSADIAELEKYKSSPQLFIEVYRANPSIHSTTYAINDSKEEIYSYGKEMQSEEIYSYEKEVQEDVEHMIESAKICLSIVNAKRPQEYDYVQTTLIKRVGVHKNIVDRIVNGDLSEAYKNSSRNNFETLIEAIEYFSMLDCSKENKRYFKCPQCSSRFYAEREMRSHLNIFHGKTNER